MYNYPELLNFNHNYHKKKKKGNFVTFFGKNLLNVTTVTSLFHLKQEKCYEICLTRKIYKTYEDYLKKPFK